MSHRGPLDVETEIYKLFGKLEMLLMTDTKRLNMPPGSLKLPHDAVSKCGGSNSVVPGRADATWGHPRGQGAACLLWQGVWAHSLASS